eukprot:478115-Amphidinium_carterae.1
MEVSIGSNPESISDSDVEGEWNRVGRFSLIATYGKPIYNPYVLRSEMARKTQVSCSAHRKLFFLDKYEVWYSDVHNVDQTVFHRLPLLKMVNGWFQCSTLSKADEDYATAILAGTTRDWLPRRSLGFSQCNALRASLGLSLGLLLMGMSFASDLPLFCSDLGASGLFLFPCTCAGALFLPSFALSCFNFGVSQTLVP